MKMTVGTEAVGSQKPRFGRAIAFLQRCTAGSEGRVKASGARMVAHMMAGITFILVWFVLYAASHFLIPDSAAWRASAQRIVMWVAVACALTIWVVTYRDVRAMMNGGAKRTGPREEA